MEMVCKIVALIGDSQGTMYSAELASLVPIYGFRLNILSRAGANELPEEPGTILGPEDQTVSRPE